MASRGVNKVIIVGNMGQDPEVRFMPNGGAVANFTVATSDSWKDKQTGEQKEKTEWHRIVMYQRLAEIAGEYLRKGSKVYIEGRLQTRKWQNQQGQDQYTTEIIANEMQMLDSRGQGAGMGGGQPMMGGQQPQQPMNQQPMGGGMQQQAPAQQGGFGGNQGGMQQQQGGFNQQPMNQQSQQPQQGGFGGGNQQQGGGFKPQQSQQQAPAQQGGFGGNQGGGQQGGFQKPQQQTQAAEPPIDFDDDIPF